MYSDRSALSSRLSMSRFNKSDSFSPFSRISNVNRMNQTPFSVQLYSSSSLLNSTEKPPFLYKSSLDLSSGFLPSSSSSVSSRISNKTSFQRHLPSSLDRYRYHSRSTSNLSNFLNATDTSHSPFFSLPINSSFSPNMEKRQLIINHFNRNHPLSSNHSPKIPRRNRIRPTYSPKPSWSTFHADPNRYDYYRPRIRERPSLAIIRKSIKIKKTQKNTEVNSSESIEDESQSGLSRFRHVIKFREHHIGEPVHKRKTSITWDLPPISLPSSASSSVKQPTRMDVIEENATPVSLKFSSSSSKLASSSETNIELVADLKTKNVSKSDKLKRKLEDIFKLDKNLDQEKNKLDENKKTDLKDVSKHFKPEKCKSKELKNSKISKGKIKNKEKVSKTSDKSLITKNENKETQLIDENEEIEKDWATKLVQEIIIKAQAKEPLGTNNKIDTISLEKNFSPKKKSIRNEQAKIDEKIVDKDKMDAMPAEKMCINKALVEEISTNKRLVDQASTGKVSTDRAMCDKTLTDKSFVNKVSANKDSTDKTLAKKTLVNKTSTNKNLAQKISSDKIGKEPTESTVLVNKILAVKTLTDKASNNKILSNQIMTDKVLTKTTFADKALPDQKSVEKFETDKILLDKSLNKKILINKTITNKGSAEKVSTDKAITDKQDTYKSMINETLSEKVSSEKILDEKIQTDQKLDGKILTDKSVIDKLFKKVDDFKSTKAENLLEQKTRVETVDTKKILSKSLKAKLDYKPITEKKKVTKSNKEKTMNNASAENFQSSSSKVSETHVLDKTETIQVINEISKSKLNENKIDKIQTDELKSSKLQCEIKKDKIKYVDKKLKVKSSEVAEAVPLKNLEIKASDLIIVKSKKPAETLELKSDSKIKKISSKIKLADKPVVDTVIPKDFQIIKNEINFDQVQTQVLVTKPDFSEKKVHSSLKVSSNDENLDTKVALSKDLESKLDKMTLSEKKTQSCKPKPAEKLFIESKTCTPLIKRSKKKSIVGKEIPFEINFETKSDNVQFKEDQAQKAKPEEIEKISANSLNLKSTDMISIDEKVENLELVSTLKVSKPEIVTFKSESEKLIEKESQSNDLPLQKQISINFKEFKLNDQSSKPSSIKKNLLKVQKFKEDEIKEGKSSEKVLSSFLVQNNIEGAQDKLCNLDLVEKDKKKSFQSSNQINDTVNLENQKNNFKIKKEPVEKLPENLVKKRIRFRKYDLDDFNLIKVLGRGSFGKVFLAELKDHNAFYAIKCLKKHVVVEDDDVESTMIERKVLALGSHHPFICKLFCTFQTLNCICFVMEFLVGGDLMFHIQKCGKFSEDRARFYAAEVVCALKFLHKKYIIYRDLKLDNILLDPQGHIRLVDFGMCQCYIYKEECLPSNFCGTPEYMAPEIIKGIQYNQAVDWWSFGVLVYEMIVGTSPFKGADEDELLWNVCYQQVEYPKEMSDACKNMVFLLLDRDPETRLGMSTSPAGSVTDQKFFSSINWKQAEKCQLKPPFVPTMKHPSDTSYFDKEFTDMAPVFTPIDISVAESLDHELFIGFEYTNPNMTD